jgi:hypothetical protein
MGHLLAWDGTDDNQRQGKLGILMHDTSKWFIRKNVAAGHKLMTPLFKHVEETGGYQNEYVNVIRDMFDFIISIDEQPVNWGIGGFKGPDDANRKFFQQLRDIVCIMCDQDAHYGMRVLAGLYWLNEHFDRIAIASQGAHDMLNFQEKYERIKEFTKPAVQVEELSDEEKAAIDEGWEDAK